MIKHPPRNANEIKDMIPIRAIITDDPGEILEAWAVRLEDGTQAEVTILPDPKAGCPWEQEPHRHGPVSLWTMRSVRRCEIVLAGLEGGLCRYYDLQGAIERLERAGVADVAGAVKADIARLRAWGRGEWAYAVVVVTLEGRCEAVWGVPSDDREAVDRAVQTSLKVLEREGRKR